MLASTKAKLAILFIALEEVRAEVTELVSAEREHWEEDPEAAPDDYETLEEFEDILTGLPALFEDADPTE